MSMPRIPLCIGCGQPTGPGPRLNQLPDGRTCPACRDRLLATLPPVLPSTQGALRFEEWAEEDETGDDYPRSA
jgi:hypothetical protein